MNDVIPRFILSTCLFAACASAPPPRYFRAQPLRDPPRQPAVVVVPKPMPLPGQLRPISRPSAAHPTTTEPVGPCTALSTDRRAAKRNNAVCNDVAAVIKAANSRAAQQPDKQRFFNAITTYDYVPGALYQIYAAPLRLTVIQLQPGEKIVGKPAAGDTTRWTAATVLAGLDQEQVLLKPVFPGQDTSLVINTNRRSYFLELHSLEEDAMPAVQWRYPQDEVAQLEATAAHQDVLEHTITARVTNTPEQLNFNYSISIERGKPAWVPLQVFDDGAKTFVRFPAAMLTREAPALFVVSSTKETQLVNYRVKNETYVVDHLFDQAELRVGQKDQEIVRVTRTR
jgi:P-type conjugative transfer protein TrbG